MAIVVLFVLFSCVVVVGGLIFCLLSFSTGGPSLDDFHYLVGHRSYFISERKWRRLLLALLLYSNFDSSDSSGADSCIPL